MSIVHATDSARDARLTAIQALLNIGAPSVGRIEIMDGTMPSDTSGAPTNILCTILLTNPCGSISGHALTFMPLAMAIASDTGTATWMRMYNSANTVVLDADVGNASSTAFAKLSNVTISNGDFISVLSLVLTD